MTITPKQVFKLCEDCFGDKSSVEAAETAVQEKLATDYSLASALFEPTKESSDVVEIKAGPELDMAVAEACRVKGWLESLQNEATGYKSPERFVLDGQSETVFWEPSVDLNAAFEAAEMVGLFEGRWLGKLITGWAVMEIDCMEVIGMKDGCSTPALAICAAILEMKG